MTDRTRFGLSSDAENQQRRRSVIDPFRNAAPNVPNPLYPPPSGHDPDADGFRAFGPLTLCFGFQRWVESAWRPKGDFDLE